MKSDSIKQSLNRKGNVIMKFIKISAVIFLLILPNMGYGDGDKFERMNEAYKELDTETGGCERVKENLAKAHNRIEELKAKINDAECDTAPYTRQIAELKQQISILRGDKRSLEQKIQSSGSNADSAANTLAQLARVKDELRAARDALKAEQEKNHDLKNQLAAFVETPPNPVRSDSVELQKLKLSSSSATSRFNNYPNYDSKNMFDNRLDTLWISGSGKISGQAINAEFEEESTIHRFYVTMPETQYGRPPQTLTLNFLSDGSSQQFTLENKFGKQRFAIQPKKTKKIEVELGEMFSGHPGTPPRFEIAEIEFYGVK
jgi:hypothetical protein